MIVKMKKNEKLTKEDLLLRDLCSVYVSPTADSVQKFQDTRQLFTMPGTARKKRKNESTFGRTTRTSFQPLGSPSIFHQNLLYSSNTTSRQILTANRRTYTRMMSTLRKIELDKLKEKEEAVKTQKRKFDYFREKIRFKPNPQGTSIYKMKENSRRKRQEEYEDAATAAAEIVSSHAAC